MLMHYNAGVVVDDGGGDLWAVGRDAVDIRWCFEWNEVKSAVNTSDSNINSSMQ